MLHAFFPGEMASFMFLSQHKDTNTMFYLFYKMTSAYDREKTHNFTQLIRHLCLCTLTQNVNAVKCLSVLRPRHLLFYKTVH